MTAGVDEMTLLELKLCWAACELDVAVNMLVSEKAEKDEILELITVEVEIVVCDNVLLRTVGERVLNDLV